MKLVTRSKSVESIAVTEADRWHMKYWPSSENYSEHIEIKFDRHGRGYQRQADFDVEVTFDDVLALIETFAANGHTAARLIHDNAKALATLDRIEAEILNFKKSVPLPQGEAATE